MRNYFLLFMMLSVGNGSLCGTNESVPYLDSEIPLEDRVEDLLGRMTLEEKIGQMCQFVDIKRLIEAEKKYTLKQIQSGDQHAFYPGYHSHDIIEMTKRGEIGSFLQVISAAEANELQSYAMESRLRIPLIIGTDSIHGHGMASGTTVFPSPITLASSFDPEILKAVGKVTAKEMRMMGSHWTFTPNLDLVRDPRWGRTGETFGEDPYLISEMGVALIQGLQGENGFGPESVLACAKHLVGGGQSVNGINGAPTDVSYRTLVEQHFPPFEEAIKRANVSTVMMAHNEVAGVPCHSSYDLMEKFLREENGFEGFIVSDWTDIERLHTNHRVAENLSEAYLLSVQNGMDMHMHGPGFYEGMLELVRSGEISENRVDKSVARILRSKFELGLFEQRFLPVDGVEEHLFDTNSQALALNAAREGIVLLKNDGILPLEKQKYAKILVLGPNADNQTLNGDWAMPQPDDHQTTVLEGIESRLGSESEIVTLPVPEHHVLNVPEGFYEQLEGAAQKVDLIIAVVGENSLRYTGKIRRTCGENYDRADLLLPGYQNEMMDVLLELGKPVVVVLVNGRPLGLEHIDEQANAILETWEPGLLGGQAISEVLAGDVNPSGKLPITVPRSVGQIQIPYNQKPSHFFRKYVFEKSTPLYPFGYGKSYTNFEFSSPELKNTTIGVEEHTQVSVTLTNNGDRAGKEVVQLYIRDDYSSITRPIKELKAFKKVELQPGGNVSVTFDVTPQMLAFYNSEMELEVEPGTFTLMVGNSSADRDLKSVSLTVE